MSSYKEMDESESLVHMKRVAFFAVVLSTVAVTAAMISVPLAFTYVQSVQSHLMAETDFCKLRARDIWVESVAMEAEQTGQIRSKRNWFFGKWVEQAGNVGSTARRVDLVIPPAPKSYEVVSSDHDGTPHTHQPPVPKKEESHDEEDVIIQPPFPAENTLPPSVVEEGSCCTCHQGPPGPPGDEGAAGADGSDGLPGRNGYNGRDGAILPADEPANEPCVVCPPGPPGIPGMMGLRGPSGPKGPSGRNGENGKPGDVGYDGPPGPTGLRGKMGDRGIRGPLGDVVLFDGPRGEPGPRGTKGQQGVKGARGIDGTDGIRGRPGQPGDRGEPGVDGAVGIEGPPGPQGTRGLRGSCTHCPPPRVPPGYKL